MKSLLLIYLLTSCFISNGYGQIVEDIDGNSYTTVTIGSQTWMQENLKSVHFANGDPIPTSVDPVDNIFESVYQWSYEDDTSYVPDYGRLYTWFATQDARNICPAGWHVPSVDEWMALSEYLGGDSLAGGQMKETGTTHWMETNSGVTNSSLFTALPGGFRGNPEGYSNMGNLAHFWTSTPWGSLVFPRGYVYKLHADTNNLEQSIAVGNCGLSVRCVQDNLTQVEIPKLEYPVKIFPNPSHGKITIQVEAFMTYDVSFFDVSGQLVLQKTIAQPFTEIDLGFLTSGIYVIRIQNDSFLREQKLVVH